MKKLLAIIAVFASVALVVIGIIIHPLQMHITFVTLEPATQLPAYLMPTFANARTPGEVALASRWAILKGDYNDADKAIKAFLAKTDPSSDEVFTFLSLVVEKNNPAYLDRLNKWIEKGGSVTPYMLRADYNFYTGLLYRGEGNVNATLPAYLKRFAGYLASTWNDLQHVRESGDRSPWFYMFAMRVVLFTGSQSLEDTVFNEAIRDNPTYYPLYSMRLSELTPLWGGSVTRMIAFVNKYDTLADKNPRFRLLTLELYFHLLRDMDINCIADTDLRCGTAMNDYLLSPSMQQRLTDLIAYYARTNLYELNREMIEDFCLCSPRNYTYEKPLMDSLVKLTGQNNYAMAFINAKIAYYHKDPRTALAYAEKALAEMQSFAFPSEEARKETLAGINTVLYEVNADLQNKAEALKNAKAAASYDQTNAFYQANLCTAYFTSNLTGEAIVSCNASLALQDSSYARFQRASAYINRQMPKQAAEDLMAVLSYNDVFKFESRSTILTMLSFIYKSNKQYTEMIRLYADYPELLADGAPDAYWRYEDRCDAYRAQGNYAKALADCEMSLKLKPTHETTVKRDEIRDLMEHKKTEIPALFAAIDAHRDAQVKQLVGQGADVNTANAYGKTALMEALDKYDWTAAELLIAHGADVKKPQDDEGKDVLFHAVVNFCNAAMTGCPDDTPQRIVGIIDSLLRAGADPQHPTQRGEAAFTQAAFFCEVPVVKLMLEHGAEIDFREKWSSNTALQEAAMTCSPEMVSLLLARHPDLTYRNSWGDTALDLANKRSDHVGPYNVGEVIGLLKAAEAR